MNPTSVTQSLNYHQGEGEEFSHLDSSIEMPSHEIRDRIRKILQRDDLFPEITDLCENVLKKYEWTLQNGETIAPNIQIALNCFVSQDPEGIEELIEWSNSPLSLGSFIQRWISENYPVTQQKIEDFISKTSVLFLSEVSHSDHEIKEYFTIIIDHAVRFESLGELTLSLLNYLSRNEYKQLSVVVQVALETKTSYAKEFVSNLISDDLVRVYCRLAKCNSDLSVKSSIEKTLEKVLLAPSHDYNDFFKHVFSELLVIEETVPLIKKILNQLDQGFFTSRLTKVLEEIVDKEDEHQHQRIHHFLRVILGNKRVLQHFNESAKNEKFLMLISTIYQWKIFPASILERFGKNVFNPFFHFHIERFLCLPKDDVIQIEILHIFLNVIQSQSKDLIEEFTTYGNTFKDTGELLKICLARFNCRIACDGRLGEFLDFILIRLKQVSEKKGPIRKKLELIIKILNTCLELKIEHIEKLARSRTIVKFYRDIKDNVLIERSTLEKFELTINAFEKSFPHLLFRTLYSMDEFKSWFHDENPHLSSEEKVRLLGDIGDIINDLNSKYGDALRGNNLNALHNNQIAALKILKEKIEQKNLFFRLRTGQGKSLIAEMAAIHLLNSANPPERVFIFTSYDHLAKRDCEEMQFLAEASGFSSIYISSKTSFVDLTDLPQKKIIHIDSLNFIDFLVQNIQRAMEKGLDISSHLKIFLNPERSAAILDEGDLLTLDDPKHGKIATFPQTFGSQPINMVSQKDKFNEMVGKSFIEKLEVHFSGCYEQWYTKTSLLNREESSGTNEASGKTFNYAASFSNNVSRGIYQFPPLSCNFCSFVRSFRDVLFLSGSINQENMPAFESYFTNGKENFYVDIPLFFGPHNQNFRLTEQRIVDQCDDINWHQHILSDVEEAMQHRRPILLFALSAEKLSKIEAKLKENGKIIESRYTWITIKDENELARHVSQIGNSQTITLATAICGRGIDVKPTKAIESGLHVIVTELPENDNERLLIQMKGRTARMDRKGSFSLIVKGNYTTFQINAENKRRKPIIGGLKLMDRKLELSKQFFETLNIPNQPQKVKNWLLFLKLIEDFIIDLSDDAIYEKAKNFLGEL